VTVPDSFDPRVTFKRAEGLIADGDVLVTYFGADVGVEVVVERAASPTRTLRHAGGSARTRAQAVVRPVVTSVSRTIV
jgi:hypothetical protein